MPQEQEVAQPKKKKALTFDAKAVFSLPDRSDDLEFNLDEEAARYRAEKGEAGDRGFGGDGSPIAYWAAYMEAICKAYGISMDDIIHGTWNGGSSWAPTEVGKKNKVYGKSKLLELATAGM